DLPESIAMQAEFEFDLSIVPLLEVSDPMYVVRSVGPVQEEPQTLTRTSVLSTSINMILQDIYESVHRFLAFVMPLSSLSRSRLFEKTSNTQRPIRTRAFESRSSYFASLAVLLLVTCRSDCLQALSFENRLSSFDSYLASSSSSSRSINREHQELAAAGFWRQPGFVDGASNNNSSSSNKVVCFSCGVSPLGNKRHLESCRFSQLLDAVLNCSVPAGTVKICPLSAGTRTAIGLAESFGFPRRSCLLAACRLAVPAPRCGDIVAELQRWEGAGDRLEEVARDVDVETLWCLASVNGRGSL
ncbi:hypothetical protein BOX15_Mlig028882g1, partial [Macrostomum lignano]